MFWLLFINFHIGPTKTVNILSLVLSMYTVCVILLIIIFKMNHQMSHIDTIALHTIEIYIGSLSN